MDEDVYNMVAILFNDFSSAHKNATIQGIEISNKLFACRMYKDENKIWQGNSLIKRFPESPSFMLRRAIHIIKSQTTHAKKGWL